VRKLLSVLAGLVLFSLPASAVTVDWVTVGDAGNACDTQLVGCFGAVDYNYDIGKYEVTNDQYTEYLNAIAATDTFGVYNTKMAIGVGGVTRSGVSGNYTYSTIAGRGSMPVNIVSFHDALRFTNWMHDGQPTGAQGAGTTEGGSYTITALGITNNTITRNAGATIVLTSEDEWYKAAYYDAGTTSYFDYTAGSDTATTCAVAGATANTANCANAIGDLAAVGSYTGAASPYGTYDQGGNIFEWNEDVIDTRRVRRGGSYNGVVNRLRAVDRGASNSTVEVGWLGFRVAVVPEPGTALLLGSGLVMLGIRGRRRGDA
jgi:formylglycine-generating enzyme required for sulfatase activity